MSLIIPANTLSSGGYAVDNSLRFNDGSSDSLSRTVSSASNQRTWTVSMWFKRSALGTFYSLIGSDATSVNSGYSVSLCLFADNKIGFLVGDVNYLISNQLLRDTSAWYHIVLAYNTGASGTDKCKLFINGVQETSFSTDNRSSAGTMNHINQAVVQYVGRTHGGGYFDGYMAEVCIIDGTQYAASDFGEFDEDSGIWKPIDVSGLTFGTNGFYLDFEDSANLGNDANGGTDLTEVNLTAVDQSIDTCTNNFATLNPLFNSAALAQTPVLSEGNLNHASTSSGSHGASSVGTFAPSSGKWYWEAKQTATVANGFASGVRVLEGWNPTAADDSSFYGDNSTFGGFGYGYSYNAGHVLHNAQFGTTNQGNGVSQNDIVGHALDLDNGAFYFSINGTFQASGDPTSGASKTNAQHSFTVDGSYAPAVYGYSSAVFQMNFGSPMHSISSGNADANGHGNFEFAVPSGYFALNTKNLSEYG
jgi:hypothetical protein